MSYEATLAALTAASLDFTRLVANQRVIPGNQNTFHFAFRLYDNLLIALRHDLTGLSLALQPADLVHPDFKPNTGYAGFLKIFENVHERAQSLDDTFAQRSHQPRIGCTMYRELHWKTEDLLKCLARLCQAYATYLAKPSEESLRRSVLELTSIAWKIIDETLEPSQRSDLEIAHGVAKSLVGMLTDALEEVQEMVERGGNKDDDDDDDDDDAGLEAQMGGLGIDEADFGTAAVRLNDAERARAHLSVPIIRLCRVFLLEIIKNRLEVWEQLRIETLEDILRVARRLPEHVDELVCELDASPQASGPIRSIIQALLTDCLRFKPLMLDPNARVLQTKKECVEDQRWLEMWQDQIKKACGALIEDLA